MLGLGCSRSAAALVSRKWEQVVGAACSVVSGGVVTEVEANFAWLARQGTPTLASVGVSFSNELATLIKQTVSRFHCQFSTQTNLHFITAKKSNKIHPDCFFDPKIPGMMPCLPWLRPLLLCCPMFSFEEVASRNSHPPLLLLPCPPTPH